MLQVIGPEGARLRQALLVVCGLALVGLAACEIPEAPEWDVGLQVPFSSDPISISDFLPGIVQADTTRDPPVFTIERQEQSETYYYGDMCAPFCALAIGQTIPEFSYSDSLDVAFSDARLISVEGVNAVLVLQFDNGLGFEPLRSSVDTTGFIAVAIRDLGSGATLDSLFFSAESMSLGAALDTTLTFAAAAITDGVRVSFSVFSPEDGQTITTNPATANVQLLGALDAIEVAAATVVVDSETLDESFTVDFDEDLRDEVMDRVLSGSYEVELVHDLELDGSLEMSIAGSQADLFAGDTLREVRLAGLVFTSDLPQRGDLTKQEIELVAQFVDIYVGYRGTASGTRPGSQSRFTPDQSVQARLKVTAQVRIGE